MGPKQRLLYAGVIAAVVVALVGIVVAAQKYLGPRDDDLLPFDVSRLPEQTSSVSRRPLRDVLGADELGAAALPEQALWSYFAEKHCGGYDVYRASMDVAQRWRHLERWQRYLAAPADELKAALACGKRLSSRVTNDTNEFTLGLSDVDADPLRLVALRSGARPEPSSSSRPLSLGGLDHGSCAPVWTAGEGECSKLSNASAQLPWGRWISGSRAGVEAFAALQSSDVRVSFQQSLVAKLATSLRAYPRVDIYFDGRQAFPRGDHYVSMPGYLATQALREALAKDLRWGVHAAAVASEQRGDDGELRVVLLSKGDAEATRIEQGLRDYREAVLPAAQEMERDYQQERGPRERRDYEHADRLASARAWQTAQIERDGLRVMLTTKTKLEPAERAARERFNQWRKLHAQAAARIVDSLLEGARPAPADVKKLRGETLVTRLADDYKPFFSGKWKCYQDGVYSYRSMIGDAAHVGEHLAQHVGRFSYEIIDTSWPSAILRFAGDTQWHIDRGMHPSDINFRKPGQKDRWGGLGCDAMGEAAVHGKPAPPDEPGTIAPIYLMLRNHEIETEDDPDWTAAAQLKLDDTFSFELSMGGGLSGAWNATKIAGDGRASHVYRHQRPVHTGNEVDYRRVEFRLTRAELRQLVHVIHHSGLLSGPRRYDDHNFSDSTFWAIRLRTTGRTKEVWLQNAFPEPLQVVARAVSALIDKRPQLHAESRLLDKPRSNVFE